jgi:hypothetical protein
LCKLGALSGALALAGCGEPPDRTPTPEPEPATPTDVAEAAERWGFDETVDLADEGVDATGERSVDRALSAVAGDGTLVYLPPGRYRLSEPLQLTSFERFGLVGRDATLVPPDGYEETLLELGVPGDASQLLVEGLDFDFGAESTGGRPVVARVDDRLVLRDLTVRGRQDVQNDMVRIDVADPEGSGLVERLRLPDGGVSGSWEDDSGITGCEVGSDNRGDVAFVDCHIAGFPDNGLYADPTEGAVRVEGGYYANSGVANVRVNAGPGSVVRNVYVRCDEARPGVENMRGIRLRGGDAPVVENCVVEFAEVTGSDGAITVHSNLSAATIRNCHVRVDTDRVPAVLVKSPEAGVDADGPVELRNVSVEGAADEEAAIDVADRSNCTIEGACIRQTGENRDGIKTENVGGRVSDALIAVRGRPLAFENSTVATADVTVDRTPERLSEVARDRCRRWGGR